MDAIKDSEGEDLPESVIYDTVSVNDIDPTA